MPPIPAPTIAIVDVVITLLLLVSAKVVWQLLVLRSPNHQAM
jgi:hypothetical protein